jgi:hypothetical protein
MVIAMVFQAGCMGACDIFNPSKELPGQYRLVQFEVDHYYIEDSTRDGDIAGGGVLGGAVEQIGWNGGRIVAWRDAMQGTSGWMVINVATRSITGPLSDEQLAEARKNLAELKSIEVFPVKEAWDRLR